jgi:hypothetical protein
LENRRGACGLTPGRTVKEKEDLALSLMVKIGDEMDKDEETSEDDNMETYW